MRAHCQHCPFQQQEQENESAVSCTHKQPDGHSTGSRLTGGSVVTLATHVPDDVGTLCTATTRFDCFLESGLQDKVHVAH